MHRSLPQLCQNCPHSFHTHTPHAPDHRLHPQLAPLRALHFCRAQHGAPRGDLHFVRHLQLHRVGGAPEGQRPRLLQREEQPPKGLVDDGGSQAAMHHSGEAADLAPQADYRVEPAQEEGGRESGE